MATTSNPHALKVVVVGGGIVGVSTAEWLRRDGHDVTIVDRGVRDRAASFGNGGILARCAVVPVVVPGIMMKAPRMLLSPDQPLFLRWSYLLKLLPWLIPYLASARRDKVIEIAAGLAPLLTDAVDQHMALAAGTPAERWLVPGDYVYLYPDRATFEADGFGWSLRRDHGIVGEELDGEQLRQRDPALGNKYDFGYRLADHGTIADPGKYLSDLLDWFTGQGGRTIEAEVRDLEPRPEGVRVHCDGHTIDADRAVIACGAWSRQLSEKIGHRPKLESERGYHIEFTGPSALPPCPYMVADAKYVATPMGANLRVAGIVEFGGLTAPASRGPLRLLASGIRKIYPDFQYTEKREWMGHRPATADSLPVLGPSEHHRDIFFAFGHHHIGLTAGAKSGRLLADMISGRHPNVDMSPYRIGRFDH